MDVWLFPFGSFNPNVAVNIHIPVFVWIHFSYRGWKTKVTMWGKTIRFLPFPDRGKGAGGFQAKGAYMSISCDFLVYTIMTDNLGEQTMKSQGKARPVWEQLLKSSRKIVELWTRCQCFCYKKEHFRQREKPTQKL